MNIRPHRSVSLYDDTQREINGQNSYWTTFHPLINGMVERKEHTSNNYIICSGCGGRIQNLQDEELHSSCKTTISPIQAINEISHFYKVAKHYNHPCRHILGRWALSLAFD